MADIKFEKNDRSCGDLFTMQEFREMCQEGFLLDSDGLGYYATEQETSDMRARPGLLRQIAATSLIPSWATHVMWYNQ